MLGTTPGIPKGMGSAWPGDKESMPGTPVGHQDCCGPKPGAACVVRSACQHPFLKPMHSRLGHKGHCLNGRFASGTTG